MNETETNNINNDAMSQAARKHNEMGKKRVCIDVDAQKRIKNHKEHKGYSQRTQSVVKQFMIFANFVCPLCPLRLKILFGMDSIIPENFKRRKYNSKKNQKKMSEIEKGKEKNCIFAFRLINVVFMMIYVLRKLGTFSTNKVLALAEMRTGLFVSMGFLIPLNTDGISSFFCLPDYKFTKNVENRDNKKDSLTLDK